MNMNIQANKCTITCLFFLSNSKKITFREIKRWRERKERGGGGNGVWGEGGKGGGGGSRREEETLQKMLITIRKKAITLISF